MAKRKIPGHGYAERSKMTRKISVVLPNYVIEWVEAQASLSGVSLAEIVRRATIALMDREALE